MKKIKIYLRLISGLFLTWKHIIARKSGKKTYEQGYFGTASGSVTIQYPKEKIPVPEVGRYQLEVAIDDCIVCDLCAKICPVDCIDIESIRSSVDLGKTSDGTTKKLHAAKFSIDMAKCMYCGLCTTVCPTECIIMTDNYDKSVSKVSDLHYTFAEMKEEDILEKKALWDKYQEEKAAAKAAALNQQSNKRE